MSKTHRTAPAKAKVRRSWWPGWIWAIPIAALGIGVWLLVRALAQGGTDITITFANIHGLDPKGTSIVYRGMTVGKVTEASLTKDGDAVKVNATVQESAAKFLTTGTVFWLQGATPSLSNLSSLSAIISGPKIMMQPGPGESRLHFNGLAHKPFLGDHGAPVLFRVSFDGAVGELSQGDAVQVRGFPVGEIKEIGFHYDVKTGEINTPVTLALYPRLFHMQGATPPDSSAALKAALKRLIEEGLRAQLDRDPPLIGGYRVMLEMTPDAPAASLTSSNGMPEIPTAPEGGLGAIVTRFKNLPIDQIMQRTLNVTKHLETLVSSPKLKDSLVQIDASLREVHKTVKRVGPKVNELVQTLDNTAGQLDQTAKTVDQSLGGTPSQTGLNDTLREIKEAARAVRSLANYLDRHPEALLSGRSGG